MNENEINNIKKNLEIYIKKNELLEKENNENKILLNINKDNIINLKCQLQFLRTEYKKEINDLKVLCEQKFDKLFKTISQRYEIGKNEIVINKENNNDLNNMTKKIDKLNEFVKEQLKDLEKRINLILKNNIIKEDNELKKNPEQVFISKLFDIYFEKDLGITYENSCILKKLSALLLIKKIQPSNVHKKFLSKNVNNNFNINDKSIEAMIDSKKNSIESIIDKISLKKINTKNMEEFKEKFYEEYGFSEEDISKNDLENIITKKNYNVEKVLKNLFKKLNYL